MVEVERIRRFVNEALDKEGTPFAERGCSQVDEISETKSRQKRTARTLDQDCELVMKRRTQTIFQQSSHRHVNITQMAVELSNFHSTRSVSVRLSITIRNQLLLTICSVSNTTVAFRYPREKIDARWISRSCDIK